MGIRPLNEREKSYFSNDPVSKVLKFLFNVMWKVDNSNCLLMSRHRKCNTLRQSRDLQVVEFDTQWISKTPNNFSMNEVMSIYAIRTTL